jgi:squalene-hopene/tetraprenyl-beta-curcumene cyclase
MILFSKKYGGLLTVAAIPVLILSYFIAKIENEKYNLGAALNILTKKPITTFTDVPNPPAKEFLVRQAPVIDEATFTPEDVTRTIKKAVENILKGFKEDEYFEFNSYLGPNFVSAYYVVLKYLNQVGTEFLPSTRLDEKVLYKILVTTQYPDGSWANVVDGSVNFGDIDTTIYNYWALKVMGEPLDSPMMVNARRFILSKGGLRHANCLSRYWQTFFGNIKWSENIYIPLFIFGDGVFGRILDFQGRVAQWVYPHVLPITYSTYFKVAKDLGSQFELKELLFENAGKPLDDPIYAYRPAAENKVEAQPGEPEPAIEKILLRMFGIQQPEGSFGGYTVSTLFGIMAYDDFIHRFPESRYVPDVKRRIKLGYRFIETMYFDNEAEYMGNLCNGRSWETILSGIALNEAGYEGTEIVKAAKYLAKKQRLNGGIPYGFDFEYASDFDDTAEAVILWNAFKGNDFFEKRIEHANSLLFGVQNDDGGYAAFDRERQGFKPIEFVTSAFADAAEIWDPSCVDVTGHVLEGFGESGYNFTNPIVKRSIDYLINVQKPNGGWEARWGNNYIYSFGAIIPGLKKVGYNLNQPWIRKSVSWVLQHQNLDGGFGESPLSYKSEKWCGVGISTPTQTAWALLGLLEIKRADVMDVGDSVERAVQFLINEMDREGKWEDKSVVGTGHRPFLMMMYLTYPRTWTTIALSRYQRYFGEGEVELETREIEREMKMEMEMEKEKQHHPFVVEAAGPVPSPTQANANGKVNPSSILEKITASVIVNGDNDE